MADAICPELLIAVQSLDDEHLADERALSSADQAPSVAEAVGGAGGIRTLE